MSNHIKGYYSDLTESNFKYVTMQRVSTNQVGLNVASREFARLVVADAAEANSTTTVITATAHQALPGDIIRWTSGALTGYEYPVASVAANTITITQPMASAPGVGDTFNILRYATPMVDASGIMQVNAAFVEAATAADGAAAPALGKMIGAFDGANLQYVSCDANGVLSEPALQTQDAVYVPGLTKVIGGVRQDAAGSPVSATGDVHPFVFNNNGELKTASTFTEQAIQVQDAVYAPGDLKIIGGVRQDAAGSPVSATGDAHPFLFNNNGELKTSATFTEVAVYAEDTAHASGDMLKAAAAVRNDAGTALAGTTLDYIPLTTDANGFVWVKPGSQQGRAKVDLIRNDYTGTPVTTGAYVQLVAATAAAINCLDVFDSSGQSLVFAVGAAAAEVDQFYISPGGNGRIELAIPAGSRVSVKAVSANATVGELLINSFS